MFEQVWMTFSHGVLMLILTDLMFLWLNYSNFKTSTFLNICMYSLTVVSNQHQWTVLNISTQIYFILHRQAPTPICLYDCYSALVRLRLLSPIHTPITASRDTAMMFLFASLFRAMCPIECFHVTSQQPKSCKSRWHSTTLDIFCIVRYRKK